MTNQDIFDGHLLGDASIINTNKNKNKEYSLTLCSKHLEYMQWCSQQMNILNDRPIWNRNRKDPRTLLTYRSYWIRSLSSKELTEERRRWYPNGIKIIPKDLNLNNTTLLNWFLDDGSLATKGGIYLATDCFIKEDLITLQEIIKRDLNLDTSLHKNGDGFRIYFDKKEANGFFNIIGECPISCFSYKWNR